MVTFMHPSGLVLSCDARVEPDALVLDYTIVNQSAAPVAALNRFTVTAPDGSARLAPEGAWRDLVDGALAVWMRELDVPPGLRVAERVACFVTPIARGERFSEALRFPRPLALHSPYRAALLQAVAPSMHTVAPVRPVPTSRLRFELGVVTVSPAVTLREDAPHVWRLWPPGPARAATTVLAVSLDLPEAIDVLDYGDVPIEEGARSSP